jgi:hypothetical protein
MLTMNRLATMRLPSECVLGVQPASEPAPIIRFPLGLGYLTFQN